MNAKLKILIADDAKVIRITLKKHLEALGHTIVGEAKNGQEAIELYDKYQPDLVTMDVTMPEVNDIKNGIEAMVKIRDKYPEAHVVVITSHGEKKLVIEAISKGAKGYILKPITKEKLYDIIANINN